MSKIKLFIFSGLFVCFLIPQTSDAYYTTKQKAVRFNETNALYIIDYYFNLPKSQGALLPIMAVRDNTDNKKALTYEILLDGKTVTDAGKATGIIVSNGAPIVDGQFHVPGGERASFRLYVMFTTPETAEEADYALAVKSLPFVTLLEDKNLNNGLTEPELKKYQTAEIELNESPIPEVKVSGSVEVGIKINI